MMIIGGKNLSLSSSRSILGSVLDPGWLFRAFLYLYRRVKVFLCQDAFYVRLIVLGLVGWLQHDLLVVKGVRFFSQWPVTWDLTTMVVIGSSITTTWRSGVIICLIAGYFMEMHSVAPQGLYISSYLFIHTLSQLLKEQVAWHHLRTQKVFYIGGLVLVNLQVSAVHVLLAGGTLSWGRLEILLDLWLMTLLQALMISVYFDHRRLFFKR